MLKSILSNRKLAKHFLLLLPCYYFRLNEGHYKNICQHCAKKNLKSITGTLQPTLFWQRHAINKKGTKIHSGHLKNQIVSKFEQSKQGDSQKDNFQSLKFPTNTHLFVLYFKEPDQLNLQLIILMYFYFWISTCSFFGWSMNTLALTRVGNQVLRRN